MAQCVTLQLVDDGSYRLIPQSSPDLNSCTYVIQSGAEVGNSIVNLTPSQGLEISVYVCSIWALAWGFRQISNVLNIGDSNEQD
jgi:hypothetical protein